MSALDRILLVATIAGLFVLGGRIDAQAIRSQQNSNINFQQQTEIEKVKSQLYNCKQSLALR